MVARVDLKADRRAGRLRVVSSHLEPGAGPGETAADLMAHLARLAEFLGLDGVEVAAMNNFSRQLRGIGRKVTE